MFLDINKHEGIQSFALPNIFYWEWKISWLERIFTHVFIAVLSTSGIHSTEGFDYTALNCNLEKGNVSLRECSGPVRQKCQTWTHVAQWRAAMFIIGWGQVIQMGLNVWLLSLIGFTAIWIIILASPTAAASSCVKRDLRRGLQI
jgi:hypothetical protein